MPQPFSDTRPFFRKSQGSQGSHRLAKVFKRKWLARIFPVDANQFLTYSITSSTIFDMSTPKLCACRFQIPLMLNSGDEIPPETLVEVIASIRRQFGAFTNLGVMQGEWEGQSEPSQWIEIAIPESRVPELKELVYSIGKRLGQKAMYFDAPPPTVEILPIDENDEEQQKPSSAGGN